MRDIPSHMLEGVALHHYSVIDWNRKSSATGFTEQEYFATMQRAWFMEELVRKHSAIMDRYDPEKKVALVVDEWGGWYEVEPGTNPGFLYQQNTLRDAMIAGVTLNIFNNHADRVRMANLAQTVNVLQAVILTEEERLLLTPTYHVMEMYNVHQDATLLPITLESQSWRMDTAALPAISASASRDHAGRVHLSLVNIDARQPQVVSVKVEGTAFDRVQGRILTATRLQAHNTFDQPEIVHPVVFTGARLNRDSLEVTMPPFSVVVLELQ
jgi:alpha-N-arabinofuranosidase